MEQLDSKELSEWIAFSKLEPFGEEREDLRTALICCTIANVNRDPKKKPTPFEVSDFMPKFEDDKEPDWQNQLEKVKMLNMAFSAN